MDDGEDDRVEEEDREASGARVGARARFIERGTDGRRAPINFSLLAVCAIRYARTAGRRLNLKFDVSGLDSAVGCACGLILRISSFTGSESSLSAASSNLQKRKVQRATSRHTVPEFYDLRAAGRRRRGTSTCRAKERTGEEGR